MVHVPAEKQKCKLDKRQIASNFLGYPGGSKRYKLSNSETRTMMEVMICHFLNMNFRKWDILLARTYLMNILISFGVNMMAI